jgi:hypothetical protein
VNEITKVPDSVTGAGHQFNYSVWTAQTVITLCKVPWNADYRDIVKFPNGQAGLDSFIDTGSGPTIQVRGATYAKFGVPVRLEIPFNVAVNYNYLRAMNPSMPIAGDVGRSFYYFINDVQYVNASVTLFHIQLDVWQSFGYDISFGNSYVEQGHIGIANENQFDDYGRTYLTVPEGLDVGGEYQVQQRASEEVASARQASGGGAPPNYEVVVISTTSLLDPPTLGTNPDGSPVPNLATAEGSDWESLANGTDTYVLQYYDFLIWLSRMRKYPWVTQGVIGIYAIPPHGRYGGTYESVTLPTGDGSTVPAFRPRAGTLGTKSVSALPNWRDNFALPSRYSRLKKFLTYPYTVCEITSYAGTPLIVKPESWSDPDATVVEIPHLAQPAPRIQFVPYRYNAGSVPVESDYMGIINDGADWIDANTGVFNFPTFALVNNGYIGFMASNMHGIAYQYSSADWAQQRALRGNQVSYDQASQGINTANQMNQNAMGANTAQMQIANQRSEWTGIIGAGQNVAVGIGRLAGKDVSGAFGAGVQAAADVAHAAVEVQSNTSTAAVQNSLAAQQTKAQTGLQGYVRDTNKDLADWAAKGDYANQIAGINAKVQDARLTQPSVSGQVGGEAFNLVTSRMGYDVKVKTISAAVMRTIGEYWLRYGYAVNDFIIPPTSLMVCEKFTYWRLKETYITAWSCPESFKQAIRGLFEKGVTVWANPHDIGNIDIADNAPLPGVSY